VRLFLNNRLLDRAQLQEIGRGGNGVVLRDPNTPRSAIKIQTSLLAGEAPHERLKWSDERLRLMVQIAHEFSRFNLDDRPRLAWPTALVENEEGLAVGFAMPYLDPIRTIEGYRLFCPDPLGSGFGHHFRSRVDYLCSLAEILAALHAGRVAVWDLKPENLRAWSVGSTRRVCLLDCDSFVLSSPDGVLDPGPGGFTAGYASPEAMAAPVPNDFASAEMQDLFAFAVIAFQAMTGVHPYDGVLHHAVEDEGRQWRIGERLYPWSTQADRRIGPPPGAKFPRYLPAETLRLFDRAFLDTARPSAKDWFEHLQSLLDHRSGKRAARICSSPGHLPMEGVCIACLSVPGAIFATLSSGEPSRSGQLRRAAKGLSDAARNAAEAWLQVAELGKRLAQRQAKIVADAAAIEDMNSVLDHQRERLRAEGAALDQERLRWRDERVLQPLRVAIATQDAPAPHISLDARREAEIAALWDEWLHTNISGSVVESDVEARGKLAKVRTQALAGFFAACQSGDLAACADALDSADILNFANISSEHRQFASRAAVYHAARSALMSTTAAQPLDAAAVAQIFDGCSDLAVSNRSITTATRGVEPLRDLAAAAFEWRALASSLEKLRHSDLGSDGLLEEAQEAEIERVVRQLTKLRFHLPKDVENRAVEARKRIAAAKRFREALAADDDAKIAKIWQENPGVADLRAFRLPETVSRTNQAMVAVEQAQQIEALCCAEMPDEAAIASAWEAAEALRASRISSAHTLEKCTLAERAELAIARRDACLRVAAAISADDPYWNPVAEEALVEGWKAEAPLLQGSAWCMTSLSGRIDSAIARVDAWHAAIRHIAPDGGQFGAVGEWLRREELCSVDDERVRTAANAAAPLRELLDMLARSPDVDERSILDLWNALPDELRPSAAAWRRQESACSVGDEISLAQEREEATRLLQAAIAGADAMALSGCHDPEAERVVEETFQRVRDLYEAPPNRHQMLWQRAAEARTLCKAWNALGVAAGSNDPRAAEEALRPLLGKGIKEPSASGLPLSPEHVALVSLGQSLGERSAVIQRYGYGGIESDRVLRELATSHELSSLDGWWQDVRPYNAPTALADAVAAAALRQRARLAIEETRGVATERRICAALAFSETEWPDATEKKNLRSRVQKSLSSAQRWIEFQALLNANPVAALEKWDEVAFAPVAAERTAEVGRTRDVVARALESLEVSVTFRDGGSTAKGPAKVELTCKRSVPTGVLFWMCAADLDPPKRRHIPSQMHQLLADPAQKAWRAAVPQQPRRAGISIWTAFQIGGEQVFSAAPLLEAHEPIRYRAALKVEKSFPRFWKQELVLRVVAVGAVEMPPLSLDCVTAGRARAKVRDLSRALLQTACQKGGLHLDYEKWPEWQQLEKIGYAPRFALSLAEPADAAWVDVNQNEAVEL
jgi:hypothetical protein